MRCLFVVVPLALAVATSAQAQSHGEARPGVAIGATAGTTGLGVEAQISLGPVFTLRGTIDKLSHDFDQGYDGVDYQAALEFDTLGGFIDMHPLGNGLFISGGAYSGSRDINLLATPSQPVELGGQTYSPSQVGTLDGRIKLQDIAPFVGVGWDDTFHRRSRWGFRALAGLAFSEAPEVALTSSGGTLSNDAAFQNRLNQEAARIVDEADGYGVFPVLQLGLNYKF